MVTDDLLPAPWQRGVGMAGRAHAWVFCLKTPRAKVYGIGAGWGTRPGSRAERKE